MALAEVRQRLHTLAQEYVTGGGGPPLLTAKNLQDSIDKPTSSYFSPERKAYRALSKAVERAERAIAELDKRPAADFAAGAPGQAKALKILGEAVKSMNALQGALRSYGEIVPEAQARCLALGRSCVQRSAEMLNFAGLAASAGRPAVQGQAEGRAEVLPAPGLNWREHALDMHGNAGVLESVNARAAALFAELDALAADTAVDGSVADKSAQLKGKIEALKEEIKQVTKEPALGASGPAAGEPRLVREAELFAVISQGLTAAEQSVDALAAMPSADAIDVMVRNDLQDLGAALTKGLAEWTDLKEDPKKINFLSPNQQKRLVALRDKFEAFKKDLQVPPRREGDEAEGQIQTLRGLLQGPLREKFEELRVLSNELMYGTAPRDAAGKPMFYDSNGYPLRRAEDGIIHNWDRGPQAAALFRVLLNSMLDYGGHVAFIDALEELDAARTRASVQPAFHSGAYLTKAFEGGVSIPAIIECHARNIDPEYMELRADPGALAGRRTLGNGAANTVTLCSFRDRRGHSTDLVFKPEYPARQGMANLLVGGMGYGGKYHVLHLNLAASDVAGAMGMRELLPTASAGSFEGRFGLFMGRAPGRTARDIVNGADSTKEGICNELRAHNKGALACANLQRELCRLEWLDLLSGQVDRHPDNYMVDIDALSGNVRVTGIDNDAAFGSAMVGVGKMDLTKLTLSVPEVLKHLAQTMGLAAADAYKAHLDSANPHGPMQPYILDLRSKGGAVFASAAAGWNQVHVPTMIDRQSFEALMAIDKGAYRAKLATHLDAAQVEAAMSRLESVQEHARYLEGKERVLEVADWKNIERMQARNQEARIEKMGGGYCYGSSLAG